VILGSFLKLFSSIKLAAILILAITCLSLVGTFTTISNFFNSWWFFTLGFLLIINILVCNISRWKIIRAAIKGGDVILPETFFEDSSKSVTMEMHLSPSATSALLKNNLQKQLYRVRIESFKEQIYLSADRFRYFRLGTYVSHLSLILLVIAYLISLFFGFQDTNFIVPEGGTREVGHNTGLSMKLVSFIDEYYADNTPMDYRSQVILYRDGHEVEQALIRVNEPLNYQGVRFHQSFYGPVVNLVLRQDGRTLYQGSVTLDSISNSQGYQRNARYLDLAQPGSSIMLLGPATNLPDPAIPKGQTAAYVYENGRQIGVGLLAKGIPTVVGGIEFNYLGASKYSGFQVSYDPGIWLIWTASSLFILGMLSALFFKHRQFWFLILPTPKGTSRITIRSISPRESISSKELKAIWYSAIGQKPDGSSGSEMRGKHGQR
jgi:cytochrome c biogenesis protein